MKTLRQHITEGLFDVEDNVKLSDEKELIQNWIITCNPRKPKIEIENNQLIVPDGDLVFSERTNRRLIKDYPLGEPFDSIKVNNRIYLIDFKAGDLNKITKCIQSNKINVERSNFKNCEFIGRKLITDSFYVSEFQNCSFNGIENIMFSDQKLEGKTFKNCKFFNVDDCYFEISCYLGEDAIIAKLSKVVGVDLFELYEWQDGKSISKDRAGLNSFLKPLMSYLGIKVPITSEIRIIDDGVIIDISNDRIFIDA